MLCITTALTSCSRGAKVRAALINKLAAARVVARPTYYRARNEQEARERFGGFLATISRIVGSVPAALRAAGQP